MSEFGKKKCQICVGCGRCVKAESGLHVITDSFLRMEPLPAGKTAGKGFFVIVDIGTTTMAMELYDERGQKQDEYVCVNPQRIAGADVISRIEVAENRLTALQLRRMVELELEKGINRFQKNNSVIGKIYIAGNTTMLNILCGHNVSPLGTAPFQADFLQSETLRIGGVLALTLPGISAFVGADVVAGILTTGMHQKEDITLLVDLGTNGEIVLGNRDKILACATAAGPAFEGMLHEQEKPIWGADVIACVAELLNRGLVDETGLLNDDYFESGIMIAGVHITQEHIRCLQTAKAAVAAGIHILCKEYGLLSAEEISRIYLAGGFGYYLNPEAALEIGLLPRCPITRIQAIGNSALAGCYAYHFCEEESGSVNRIVSMVKVLNLAETEGFSDSFIENMKLADTIME